MSLDKFKRRDFLKLMGWGGVGAGLAACDVPTTVTIREGDEEVVAYLMPEEYVIPGVGVWYSSTCQQCPAGCGVQGRVREGRVIKLEGNPESAINKGKLCQMGQAGLQAHYNPDRVTQPKIRKNGSLVDASWDDALALIESRTGASSGLKGDAFAWLTGTVSGHQSVLIDAYSSAVGSSNHFVHETIHNKVWETVCQDMLGEPSPVLDVENAAVILSFGADFLGTWSSPVQFSTEYTKFRDAPRGVLIQAEPRMTMTGANADLWLGLRSGTEGALALSIANVLAGQHKVSLSGVPASIVRQIKAHSLDLVEESTGVSADHVEKIAEWLAERESSLVLAGASAEGQAHGYDAVAAIMTLNIILGNVGKTIRSSGTFSFPQLLPKTGGGKDLLALAEAAENKQLDVLFVHNSNPLYTAPNFLNLKSKLSAVSFKVVFTQFEDETSLEADVVLPIASAIEDWGTHVTAYQAESGGIGIQQPLMEPIFSETRGFGDVLLGLLRNRDKNYAEIPDYYSYLKKAFASLPGQLKNNQSDEGFWQSALQSGTVQTPVSSRNLKSKIVDFNVASSNQGQEYPHNLVPSARLGLWDGRHANIPWLQEAPDQISKVVWESWVEIHPKMASKLHVKEGDFVKVSSSEGSIEAKVYIFKGINPNAVAIPMGQGHERYGRYATGIGVNPLKILAPVNDQKTGELALFGTQVKIEKTGRHEVLARFGGSETQIGRKLVATVPAKVFNRLEGGGNNVA